jgi:DNA (cytosine-5)-methyltransferase 1
LDFFVFENVRGINYARHRNTFADFKSKFARAGFSLHEGLLDSLDFGVPQRRPRVFVVGFSREKFEGWDFVFPRSGRRRELTVGDVIRGLPPPTPFRRKLEPSKIPYHRNHWTMNPRSSKFKNGNLKEGQNKGRSFRVLSWNMPSWTVAYGNREVHIHPSGSRRLSVLEAMLIQGFPRRYVLSGTLSEQFRQVSDAVPPPVAQALARHIYLFLQGDNRARKPSSTKPNQLHLL